MVNVTIQQHLGIKLTSARNKRLKIINFDFDLFHLISNFKDVHELKLEIEKKRVNQNPANVD